MSNGQSLKIILFLFVLSFLNYGSSSDLTHISHFCSNTTVFTINSTYQVNLNTLLSSLASRGPDNNKFSIGFYNDTAGQGPDKVYGLYQCRGDVSSTTCEDCVNFATRDVTQRCPVEKGAVIWYDQCLLRYSNGSISSVMVERPRVAMYNTQNGTDPDRFNSEVGRVMNEVVTQAVSSPKKFGTRANNVTVVFQPLSGVVNFRMYGLAQCTLDLPTRDCNICLRRALALIPSCCDFRIGGRILTPSCNIRYEIYSFYNETLPSPPPIGSPPRKGTKTTRIAIWVSASASVLVVLCGLFLWRMLRKDKTEKKPYNQEVQLFHHGEDQIPNHYSLLGEHKGESQDFPLLPLSLVLEATQHFSQENKLGEGGFGPVYKGVLSHGEEFAVKRFSRASAQGLQEFKNEVTLIAKLQHKNLVRLLGCCFEEEELILIYEYMPNKSLDFFIFDPTLSAQLDWTRRTNIISGTARGILYLHEDSRLRIIHRDLKASNVLLDQDMNAKISDFGMARIFGGNQNEANTNRIVGTYGYMAPEYAMEGLFSIKSDVFSFGVLLLEIISGRKNNKFHHSEQGQSLLTYTWKLWCEGQAMKVMDPVLAQSCPHSEALKCIHIGLLCVQEDPADRPTMSSVVLMLGSDTVMLPQPSEPAFSVGRVVVKATEFSSNVKICSANQVTVSTLSPR